MAVTCPNGHSSASEDYCDTCGSPIGGEGSSASAPPPLPDAGGPGPGAEGAGAVEGADGGAPAPSGKTCPNCASVSVDDALFCESCGYDYTTGAMPRPPEPVSELDLGGAVAEAAAEAAAPEGPAPEARTPAVAEKPATWVAEIWVDPDWYAQQETDEPCPSPGLPVTVPLTEQSLLIGRRSVSRNISPQLDCSSDIGVSRRHAQLTTDGQRWFVEDLQSSNGTFVGDTRGPLPTQSLPAGQKRELDEDDRIYLGAWTRIVVRELMPGEVIS